MINESVKAALAVPGLYALTCKPEEDCVVFVEVDAEGKAYQLEPRAMTRDGELNAEGLGDYAVMTRTFFIKEISK